MTCSARDGPLVGFSEISAEMRSRVTPGVGSTMEIRRPASLLKRLLLPTFGRPMMASLGSMTAPHYRANPPRPCGGFVCERGAEIVLRRAIRCGENVYRALIALTKAW